MMRLAPKNHQREIFARQKQLIWLVFGWILLAWVLDVIFAKQQILLKSAAVGACLSYVAQSVFTKIAYRRTGAKYRQTIMLNMYLGQMLKWLLTLLGFALIFITIKPINALAVFVSYLAMQLFGVLAMWKIGD